MNAEAPLLIHAGEPSGWQTVSDKELEFKFCVAAIPTLWKTLIPDTRSFIAPVILAGALGYLMFRAWQVHNQPLL